jgi:hypothetical protein
VLVLAILPIYAIFCLKKKQLATTLPVRGMFSLKYLIEANVSLAEFALLKIW